MPLTVEIVTADRIVTTERGVEFLLAPGSEGVLGILPQHVPLMTALKPGELMMRRGGEETHFAVTGGFLEVRRDVVTILADQAEISEDIDVARAQAARARAEERIQRGEHGQSDIDLIRAKAALHRSLVRLRVSEYRRSRPGSGVPRPLGQ